MRSWGRSVFLWFALLLALPILIPLGFVMLIAVHRQIMHFVPRASATMAIPELSATVTATAYQDGSRYLDIRLNGRRYVRQLPRPRSIFDLDPTPWFETCVYRTARNEIAFNMWRHVEIIANEARRAEDGVRALEGAVYLGVFESGPQRGHIIFKPAEPARPAGPFRESRSAC